MNKMDYNVHHGDTENTEVSYVICNLFSVFSVSPW